MTREEVLQAAQQIVCADREKQYGSPEDNFAAISQYWAYYTGLDLTPLDVANMMILLKLARESSGHHKDDNYIDIAGYASCAAEIAERERAREDTQ